MKPPSAKSCPTCGERYEGDVLFCPKDGTPLSNTRSASFQNNEADPYVGVELAGQIRIKHLIGIGSMGRVYRAFQAGIERDVAVKILHRELSGNAELVGRFHREAKVASRLVHPNVVQVLMTGTVPFRADPRVGGEMYLVMEHLDGISLLSALAAAGNTGTAALPLPRALHIVLQLCDAVGEAHVQGIVHRDLKPENVMLIRRGEDPDYVKVLDFGIARIDWANQSMATQAGLIFGTAKYISPEGAAGEGVGPPADVYSIATILYQCLAGRAPFEDESPVALLVQHTHAVPPELRSIPRASYVPAPIAEVVMQNLAKKPSARAQDARAFGRDLVAAMRASGLDPEEIIAHSTLLVRGAVRLASHARTKSMDMTPELASVIAQASKAPPLPAPPAPPLSSPTTPPVQSEAPALPREGERPSMTTPPVSAPTVSALMVGVRPTDTMVVHASELIDVMPPPLPVPPPTSEEIAPVAGPAFVPAPEGAPRRAVTPAPLQSASQQDETRAAAEIASAPEPKSVTADAPAAAPSATATVLAEVAVATDAPPAAEVSPPIRRVPRMGATTVPFGGASRTSVTSASSDLEEGPRGSTPATEASSAPPAIARDPAPGTTAASAQASVSTAAATDEVTRIAPPELVAERLAEVSTSAASEEPTKVAPPSQIESARAAIAGAIDEAATAAATSARAEDLGPRAPSDPALVPVLPVPAGVTPPPPSLQTLFDAPAPHAISAPPPLAMDASNDAAGLSADVASAPVAPVRPGGTQVGPSPFDGDSIDTSLPPLPSEGVGHATGPLAARTSQPNVVSQGGANRSAGSHAPELDWNDAPKPPFQSTMQGTSVESAPATPAPRSRFPRILGIFAIAAAAAVTAVGVGRYFHGAHSAESNDPLDDLVEQARECARTRSWDSPPGANVKDITARALEQAPGDPRILEVRREAAEKIVAEALGLKYAGDHEGAMRLAKLAVELNPDLPTAQKLAAELEAEILASAQASASGTPDARTAPTGSSRTAAPKGTGKASLPPSSAQPPTKGTASTVAPAKTGKPNVPPTNSGGPAVLPQPTNTGPWL